MRVTALRRTTTFDHQVSLYKTFLPRRLALLQSSSCGNVSWWPPTPNNLLAIVPPSLLALIKHHGAFSAQFKLTVMRNRDRSGDDSTVGIFARDRICHQRNSALTRGVSSPPADSPEEGKGLLRHALTNRLASFSSTKLTIHRAAERRLTSESTCSVLSGSSEDA